MIKTAKPAAGAKDQADHLLDLLPLRLDPDGRAQLRWNKPVLALLQLVRDLRERTTNLEFQLEAAERQIDMLWRQIL